MHCGVPMTDSDRAEMRAFCDLFRQTMAREIDEPLFLPGEVRVRVAE
jgi:hypothetical protein